VIRVPTGVAIRDARQHLFSAAERVLLRSGPAALTSRAVTDEAGVAKGVLHRHFTDFDGFLAELVHDRIARVQSQAVELRESAGTGTVAGNLTTALTSLFGSVAESIVSLLIFRDELRARLRQTHPTGIPLASEAAEMVISYLALERDLGRIAAGADIASMALTLVGAGHLQFADREAAGPPRVEAIEKIIKTVLASGMPPV
jgi:AcrR family transcriptional regulator